MMRTLQEIKKNVIQGKGDYCCVNKPLLDIELDHVIVDELHMLLHITDVLLDDIVTEVFDWDKEDDFEKDSNQPQGCHLRQLIAVIRSFGVGFDVWELRNPADKKLTGTYEFTSLLGNDKKKLLNLLPEKLPQVLRPDTYIGISKLWADFRSLYTEINCWSPEKLPENSWCKAKKWIESFIFLRQKRSGYERKQITPYMHILFAHVPYFLQQHKCLKIFTGQGVEKNNDTARNVVRHKTNHRDSVGNILRIEHRQRQLKDREKMHRAYVKTNSLY